MDSDESIRILIADDNDSDRLILSSIIRKQGHSVIEARDGVEAVALYSKELPDLILMDALMPNLDGKGAAKQIRELAGEEDLIPIIFLTSLQDTKSLAECLEAGGDDFLSKPYNRSILQAKIKAFYRMRRMHATMLEQNKQIQASNEHLVQEQEVAKAVFDNVAHAGTLSATNIKYILSPLAVFNGDVLLAAPRPDGDMHILLGDFTGHGLPAAIGAMPLAEIFYGMTKKGFSIQDILSEINMKLKKILPIGVFCCCCAAHIDFTDTTIQIWVGGLPDVLIYRNDAKQIDRISSNHLPLGVLDNASFDSGLQTFDFSVGDRFYMWSDGIHEARNNENEMFGEDRVLDVFQSNKNPESVFDELHDQLEQWIGEEEKDDDTTMLEFTMVSEDELEHIDLDFDQGKISGPSNWSSEYVLYGPSLRDYNPLPLMLQMLMEVPGLRSYSGQLYTLMAELFSNAFEHGVLELDSKLKRSPDGFAEYYALRQQKAETLESGFVKISLTHNQIEGGGVLSIRLEDSGKGFDYESNLNKSLGASGYSGRGLPLLESLCDSLEYRGAGNIVEARLRWYLKQSKQENKLQ